MTDSSLSIWNWTKGNGGFQKDLCGCLVTVTDWLLVIPQQRTDYWRELSLIIEHEFPDRIWPKDNPSPSGVAKIIAFNDHPNTTVDDVNRICELAELPFRFQGDGKANG